MHIDIQYILGGWVLGEELPQMSMVLEYGLPKVKKGIKPMLSPTFNNNTRNIREQCKSI